MGKQGKPLSFKGTLFLLNTLPQSKSNQTRINLPPRNQTVHDPGRRFHCIQRNRRRINLRREVPRRKLRLETRPALPPLHGQLRPRYKRQPVLHHHRRNPPPRRKARRLWPGDQWKEHRSQGREYAHPGRQTHHRRDDRRLRRADGSGVRRCR